MKILHYIPSIDRASGGVGAYLQLLAKELGKLVDLHIVTHRSENMLTIEGAKLHFIDRGLFRLHKSKGQFEQVLQEVKPDVVHVNCCWEPLCSFTVFWAKSTSYKVVLTPHGMLEPWIVKRHYLTKKLPAIVLYQKRAVRLADLVQATAESEKGNLKNLGWNDHITVVPNGIDVDVIPLKRSWDLKHNVLFLSRVHVKKGINFLIEAVAQLKGDFAGWIFTIAGESDGDYVEELKRFAVTLGVDNLFRFVGGVYGDAKWGLYQQADLFVLPTHSENFGIVVAEALACGTPVITTKGTPWSDLEDGACRCGWWTEVGTQPTMEALRQFLSLTEEQREMMGRNGRRLVTEKFSTRMVASQFVEMYKGLCR